MKEVEKKKRWTDGVPAPKRFLPERLFMRSSYLEESPTFPKNAQSSLHPSIPDSAF